MVANASSKSKRWYLNEVFYWRCISSAIWASVIQIFTCVFLITMLKVNLIPHIWLTDAVSTIFSMYSLSQVLTAAVIVTATVAIHACCFQMSPYLNTKRIALLWRILQPRHMLVILFFAISSAIMVCISLRPFEEFSSLTGPCLNHSNLLCVNHRFLIPVLNGGFNGLVFGIHYFVSDYLYLPFKVVQQRKTIQIKQSVRPKFAESALLALSNMKWFAVAYCITGASITSYIETIMKLQTSDREYSALWYSVYSLLDVKLWWVMMWTSSAMCFLFWETLHVFQIYQTEIVNFQIENLFTDSQLQTLLLVMTCKDFPLLQYMGHLDFVQLSQWNIERRKQIFKLSQPGGHPRNFAEISSQCLSIITSLTNTLNPRVEQNPKSDKLEQSEWKSFEKTSPQRAMPIKPIPSPIDTIAQYFQRKKKEFVAALLNIRPIGYFFKELPDVKNRQAFSKCQPHIWALEALAFLVVSACNEDKFGVVQTVLPEILIAFLNLQKALEPKIDNSNLRKHGKDLSSLPPDIYLKRALQYSLVAALYKIAMTYGQNMRNLPLPGNYQAMLARYLAFKM